MPPQGEVDEIEMSDVAADVNVAAVAAFFAADTTDVLSAVEAAYGGRWMAFDSKANVQ